MRAKKTGILTFHKCINYGSYWQARYLAEALQLRGMNAVILDYHSSRINMAEWRCAYQPVLPTPVLRSDYPLYRAKMKRFFEAFELLPISKSFPLNSPDQMEAYNTVVVGSDEVWNLYHPWYGKCALFFGDGIAAERTVSYAASFGNYPAEYGLDSRFANQLYNFDAISVRDKNAQTIVQNALGIEPTIVLDPCLQFPTALEREEHEILQAPYLALYGHNFSNDFIQEIRRWAKQSSLPIISIGYRNDWADVQWIEAGPLQFPQFIHDATAVVTNFFHGCVFALRYAKPFVCETTPYRSQKITSLLTMLRAEKHMMLQNTPAVLIDACLTQPLDEQIHHHINHYRLISNDYLSHALNDQQIKVA